MIFSTSHIPGIAGYEAFKYMPYGPVLEVLPYVGRRAIENKGFVRTQKERRLMKKELVRRWKKGQLTYNPEHHKIYRCKFEDCSEKITEIQKPSEENKPNPLTQGDERK